MVAPDMAGHAQRGYRAYGETTDFKNYAGLPMPEWGDLGDRIQAAWVAAAAAIRATPGDDQPPG